MAKEENEVAMEILEQMVWSAIFYYHRGEIALRLTLVGKSQFRSVLIYAPLAGSLEQAGRSWI